MSRDYRLVQWGLVAICTAASAVLFALFFERLPIEGTTLAIDWRGIWSAIEGGMLRYESYRGFRIPPWNALLMLPLGFLSMRASWGIIVFLTTLVLIVSVPRVKPRWLLWLSVLLLTASFLALRHAVDGNFEALVIGGVLLAVYGYERRQPYILAAGILLATAKPQETVVLMVTLAVYVLQTFPRPLLFRLAAALAVVVIPLMVWTGQEWLEAMLTISQRGSIADMSLISTGGRAGGVWNVIALALWFLVLGGSLVVAWISGRSLSRYKATMLIAASLLIAPYSAGNSALTLLAVGIIPLFQACPKLGIPFLVVMNIPIFFHSGSVADWIMYYWTTVILLIWGVMAWLIFQERQSPSGAFTPGALRSSEAAQLRR